MPIEDISQLITELEKQNELKRVKTEVDPNLEIAEILRRIMYANGPAVLFENVKDYDACFGQCIWFHEEIRDRS